MRTNIDKRKFPLWLTAVLCLALAVLCLALAVLGTLQFAGVGSKWMTLLAGFGIIIMLAFGELKRLCNLPSLLLLGYALFSWLTIFWAMSGKFHLREWSKILIALAVFLFIVLRKRFDRAFARRVMGVITGMSAIYAFASVEAAATGVCKALVMRLPGAAAMQIGFTGSRLFGIFGNSNIEASIFAIGILFSIALLCGSEKRWQRVLYALTLSLCTFAFLLVFSMVATLCFAAAVIVYLIAAGNGRGAALVRMVEAAAPTLVFAFLAPDLFGREGAAFAVVALMLANAAVTVALELTVAGRIGAVLGKHQKLTFGAILAIILLCAVYAAVGTQLTGAYTFGGILDRAAYLDSGEHTLRVEAEGNVTILLSSKTHRDIIRGERTWLANERAENEVVFTVPEGSEICYFRFFGESGDVIYSATVDGEIKLPLQYKILPGFAANRIQNLSANSSTIQRKIYREDAMKLFRLSPAVGSGVGSFETGVTSVQDYPYESKYVHNHYVQILLEDGVIGFVFFAASLLAMAVVLWKKCRRTEEREFRWLYPALCAEFVMNGAQMCWDVSMSMIVFLCMTYATYGLIVRAFAEPLKKAEVPAEEKPKKGKKQAAKEKEVPLPRIAAVAVAGLIALTLCGNLYAEKLSNMHVSSEEGFFRNLEKAVRLDLYEYNDSKLSYVVNSVQAESERYLTQANAYAKELAQVQSNTIPRYLVSYYLQTGQYAEAIDEAMLGATYSATDADTWNKCAALLKQAFFDSGEASPLQSDDGTLARKLGEYRAAFEAHNAAALVPVELDEDAQAFFESVAALAVK